MSTKSHWPIEPSFLSVLHDNGNQLKDLNNHGIFQPEYLQGFLATFSNNKNVQNPLTLYQFIPIGSDIIDDSYDKIIFRIKDENINPLIRNYLGNREIVGIETGPYFKIKDCCAFYREFYDEKKCISPICFRYDSRVGLLSNPQLTKSNCFERIEKAVDEFNTKISIEKYKIKVKEFQGEGKFYIEYVCPVSDLIETIYPIFFEGKIIAALMQGQILPDNINRDNIFGNFKKGLNKIERIKFDEKLKNVFEKHDEQLKRVKNYSELRKKNIETTFKTISKFEVRITNRVNLHRHNYVFKTFSEIESKLQKETLAGNSIEEKYDLTIEKLGKITSKALKKINKTFNYKNGFIRIIGIKDFYKVSSLEIIASSDYENIENIKFKLDIESLKEYLFKNKSIETKKLKKNEITEYILPYINSDLDIDKKDVFRVFPTISPKVTFIIWKRYQDDTFTQNEGYKIYEKAMFDFYTHIAAIYTAMWGFLSEKTLEDNIRISGHETAQIIPVIKKSISENFENTDKLVSLIRHNQLYIKVQDVLNQIDLLKNIFEKPRLIFRDIELTYRKVRLFKELLFKLRNLYSSAAQYKDSKIVITRDENDIEFQADYSYLEHAINNIFDNAVKYCYDGTNIITKAIVRNETLRIQITNFSSEIEKNGNIYKLYYRGENQKKQIQGLGIGMYITKKIIEAHNGKVYHTSNLIFPYHLPAVHYACISKNKNLVDSIPSEAIDYYNKLNKHLIYSAIAMKEDKNSNFQTPYYRPGSIEIQGVIGLKTYKNNFLIDLPLNKLKNENSFT